MLHAILTLLILSSSLSALPKRAQATEDRRAELERAASDLAELGFELELARVELESVSKKQLREEILTQTLLLRPVEQAETVCAWFQGFGVWSFDDGQEMLELGAKQMAGYYAALYLAGRDRIVMVENDGGLLDGLADPEMLLVHELVHAWRDQHTSIAPSMVANSPSCEQTNLRSCLLEGEAQFTMLAVKMLRGGFPVEDLTPDDMELPMARLLGFDAATMTYEFGGRHAATVWRDGGWGALRAAWERPPTSTEQLLHPRKLGVDGPQRPTLPPWPADLPAAELVRSECLGEMQVYAMLRLTGVAAREARVAAAGWDGDRLDHYRTARGETALVWRVVWDRELDARQFYEALAAAGDGEWRVEGRVVDWVRTVDGALSAALLEALARHDAPDRRGSRDAATTEAVEAAWAAELDDEPYLCEGRWVVPACGLSLEAPEGWRADMLNNERTLSGETESGVRGTLIVSLALSLGMDRETMFEKVLEQFERMNFESLRHERRNLMGEEVLWIESTIGRMPPFTTRAVVVPRGKRQWILALSLPGEATQEGLRLTDRLFASARLDADEFTRPEPEEQVEQEAPPPIEAHARLFLLDGPSGEPLVDQDVWVAPTSAVGYGDHDQRKRERMLARGRRYRTDAAGGVRISLRSRHQWVFARDGGMVVSDNVVLEPDETRYLHSQALQDLVVRVVDEAGKPVRRVPLAILTNRWNRSELLETRVTHTRRGEVRWKHIFGLLASNGGTEEYYVTFAFPVADPPRVRIRPGDDLSEPITLTLPPTGEFVLRIDPDSAARDTVAPTYDSEPSRKMYFTEIVDAGDPRGVEYDGSRGRDTREFRDERGTHYFRFIGLGLELDVTPGSYRYETRRVAGPTKPGERVEVVLEPHRMIKSTGEAPPRAADSGAAALRVVDVDGAPISGAECSFRSTLRGLDAFEDPSFFHTRALWSATTDDSGVVRFDARGSLSGTGSGETLIVDEDDDVSVDVSIRAPGFAPLGCTELDPDADELTLTMEREEDQGRLEGTLILPGEVARAGSALDLLVSVWVEPLDHRGASVGIPRRRLEGALVEFSFDALSPGPYRLHLEFGSPSSTGHDCGNDLEEDERPFLVANRPPPIHEPLSFKISPGQNLLLDPIDLRPQLAVYRLALRAPDGQPLAHGTRVDVQLTDRLISRHSAGEDGELFLLAASSKPYLDVRLSVEGYSRHRVIGRERDVEVLLAGLIPIRLRPSPTPVLPDERARLEVSLSYMPFGLDTGLLNMTDRLPLDGGETTFELDSPGSWRVHWYAVRGEGSAARRREIIAGPSSDPLWIVPSAEEALHTIPPPSPRALERAFQKLDR